MRFTHMIASRSVIEGFGSFAQAKSRHCDVSPKAVPIVMSAL